MCICRVGMPFRMRGGKTRSCKSPNKTEIMKIIAGLPRRGKRGEMEQSERKWSSSLGLSVSQSVITPGDIWPFKKQFAATKSRRWHAACMAEGGGGRQTRCPVPNCCVGGCVNGVLAFPILEQEWGAWTPCSVHLSSKCKVALPSLLSN